jgi:hypothetical protein
MIQLVSATIGAGVALLLLAISLFNGVDWLEGLFHAAISGGVMALIARQWCRLIYRASKEADSSTPGGADTGTDAKQPNSTGHASH